MEPTKLIDMYKRNKTWVFVTNQGTFIGMQSLAKIWGLTTNTISERIRKYGVGSNQILGPEKQRRAKEVPRFCPNCDKKFMVKWYIKKTYCCKQCAYEAREISNIDFGAALVGMQDRMSINQIPVGSWEVRR